MDQLNISLKQKWSNDVSNLILLYKSHPELYTTPQIQQNFLDLTIRFNRISVNAYNLEEVSNKINALRKKLIAVEKTKRETGAMPTWKMYDELRFLIPYIAELKIGARPKTKTDGNEASRKDRNAYVNSFVNCVLLDLKKIKSAEVQDDVMRKIRKTIDGELKKQS